MSDELRKCPFCPDGGRFIGYNIATDDWCGDNYVYCGTCGAKLGKGNLPKEELRTQWNTRPLEDALLARATKAETRADHVETDNICLRFENDALKSMVERLIEAGWQLDNQLAGIEPTQGNYVMRSQNKFRPLAEEWKERK